MPHGSMDRRLRTRIEDRSAYLRDCSSAARDPYIIQPATDCVPPSASEIARHRGIRWASRGMYTYAAPLPARSRGIAAIDKLAAAPRSEEDRGEHVGPHRRELDDAPPYISSAPSFRRRWSRAGWSAPRRLLFLHGASTSCGIRSLLLRAARPARASLHSQVHGAALPPAHHSAVGSVVLTPIFMDSWTTAGAPAFASQIPDLGPILA
ncbi:hypothetical protein DFH06DRAFT_1327424 [Mycena polygramma]|nr:hypothetical protein DFH06DRAFT_1327424 [Mycena polygramma]